MTDQWISLATPLRDTAYTVCYYSQLDFDNISYNPCKSSSTFEVVLLAVVIASSYRILQCIRLGISQGKYMFTPHMVNTIKYLCSLSAAIVSFIYNQGYSVLLWVWIINSSLATFFSYYWDLKKDWDLLEDNSRNFLLRKYITF
jgi:hypothetical protein